MKTEELRKLAEAATPGPWSQDHRKRHNSWSTEVFCAKGEPIATLEWYPKPLRNGVTGTYRPDNAAYIAALPPARVLLMLDAIDGAHVLLDSLANHTLSRNNLENLASEWLVEFAALKEGA